MYMLVKYTRISPF